MKNQPKDNYVTQTSFNKEMRGVHQQFRKIDQRFEKIDQRFEKIDQRFEKIDQRFEAMDQKIDRLDRKIDNVALTVIHTNERLDVIEQTMATKSDINLILDRIDHFTKQMSVFDQEERVQGLHLQEVRQQVNDHEKRLTSLESAR